MPHINAPVFYKYKLDVDLAKMYSIAVDKHKNYVYTRGNNFPITAQDDTDNIFDNLYQQFFDRAVNLFGPLELDAKNARTCWAYITNKDFYRGGIHDHMRTSTINSVFYVNAPQTNKYRDGVLSFYNQRNTEMFTYTPQAGELIIFPNYFKHQPLQMFTDEYRVSINMEIRCKDVWWVKTDPVQ
jgi:hypothetical protein